VALELIAHMHEGHRGGHFSIPVVDFARVFAPTAAESELRKVAARGALDFEATGDMQGLFQLKRGPRALFDLGREGLVMRIPERMSGTYRLTPGAFHIEFNRGAELEGCKRLFMLVCKRVVSVDVSGTRVDVHMPSKLFDLCVEFE